MNEEPETPSLLEPETPPTETSEPQSLLEQPQPEPEPFVPLSVEDISFPEGMEVADDIRSEFLELVNNQELSAKDRAQALIDLQAKAATAASEANSQAFVEQQKTWQEEVKNDPEVGGANFQNTLGTISRLVDEYGSKELLEVMAATGAGNNVHVIKFLHAVASKVVEGTPATGVPTSAESSRAERMFPSMKKG